MWFFSPKEEKVNETPSEKVVSNIVDRHDGETSSSESSAQIDNEPAEIKIEDGKLYYPPSPTSISTKERTIRDLLYFPYGCLSKDVDSREKARKALASNFGSFQEDGYDINMYMN